MCGNIFQINSTFQISNDYAAKFISSYLREAWSGLIDLNRTIV